MPKNPLSWAPTIALSWLWGLGFFYSMHVAYMQGWAGFLAFAIPNALGLAGFGIVLDRRGPRGDLEAWFMRASEGHVGAMLAYQALAVEITVFGFLTCLAGPLLGPSSVAAVLVVALAAMACGQRMGLTGLRRLHAAYAAIGATAAVGALLAMSALPGDAPVRGFDARSGGLLVPTLVGFLLGPWLDVQHWQRAARIRRDGGSLTVAYGAGAALFLGFVTLNALFVLRLPELPGLHVNLGGVADATQILAHALGEAGNPLPLALFAVWAAVAMASTLDSSWSAIRWFLTGVAARSVNPVMAMVPAGLVRTPLWTFLAAFAVATAGMLLNASLLDLAAPYATFFVGWSACLLLQSVRGATAPDAMLCALLGALSATVFAVGYYGGMPLLTTVAALIPLASVVGQRRRGEVPAEPVEATPQAAGRVPAAVAAMPPAMQGSLVVPAGASALDAAILAGRGFFDGEWFNLVHTPTYDDTNSVGNVYFANYIRWVGKAREMFFAKCLPDFDLARTGYFILTRSIQHSFVSEAKEFETAVIRLRVGRHNRKFATLEHEIRAADGRMLGKGEQQLMFVDSRSYRLVDVPGEVLTGFMPFFPKGKTAAPAVM